MLDKLEKILYSLRISSLELKIEKFFTQEFTFNNNLFIPVFFSNTNPIPIYIYCEGWDRNYLQKKVDAIKKDKFEFFKNYVYSRALSYDLKEKDENFFIKKLIESLKSWDNETNPDVLKYSEYQIRNSNIKVFYPKIYEFRINNSSILLFNNFEIIIARGSGSEMNSDESNLSINDYENNFTLKYDEIGGKFYVFALFRGMNNFLSEIYSDIPFSSESSFINRNLDNYFIKIEKRENRITYSNYGANVPTFVDNDNSGICLETNLYAQDNHNKYISFSNKGENLSFSLKEVTIDNNV